MSDDAELAKLREIKRAAEFALGVLWMTEFHSRKVRDAYATLCNAFGGPGSKGLEAAIQRAVEAGYEADHPPGADWWCGKESDKKTAETTACLAPQGYVSDAAYLSLLHEMGIKLDRVRKQFRVREVVMKQRNGLEVMLPILDVHHHLDGGIEIIVGES